MTALPRPELMKISVKQEHIEMGKHWNMGRCPIALAMTEHLKRTVAVGVDRFYLAGGYFGGLPVFCKKFIHDFDLGLPVKPFSFRIKEPND